ncbi:hypothetical protein LJC00_03765, partial [Dysgonomonas sp. OttesenSCG-928-M03]|nr:hypothetical protein [Dysgonomonas sp. OttesenSCG-928-M03]
YIPSDIPSVNYLWDRGSNTINTNSEAQISEFNRQKGTTSFDIATDKPTKAELPLIYYKGYKASLDGKEIELVQSSNGLVEISIPKSGQVTTWYNGTLIQRISLIISLMTFIVLIIYIIKNKNKHIE